MSVTAKFLADFSDFQSAVQKAEVSLKSFETGAGKVESALSKMADSFSGRKIVQDAELATKAVTEIGGATKLTEAEQAKLNAQLTEAIAKYKALGIQAPADMLKLKNETQGAADAMAKVPATTTSIIGSLGKLASAVGIGFSIGAVVNFGKTVLDTAGHIQDLSEQMGISTDAVQGFKEAAELSGSSLDSVSGALTKMNDNLAGGEKSTVNALRDLGLKFSDIRQLSPEDAFLAITDAIRGVSDPMEQARIAIDVFGKKGAELLPAIKAGFRDVSDQASKMSKDTIHALDDAGDAWVKFKNRIVNVSGDVAGQVIVDAEKATRSWKDLFEFLGSFTPGGTRRDLPKRPQDINLPVETQPPPIVPKKTQEELDAIAKHMKDIRDLQGQIFGTEVQTAAKNYAEAIGKVGNLSKVTKEQQAEINKVMEAAIKAYTAQGKIAPAAIRDIWAATVDLSKLLPVVQEGLPRGFERIGEAAGRVEIPLENLTTEGIRFGSTLDTWLYKTGVSIGGLPPKVKEVTLDFSDLSQALSQLAQISGGTFGGITRDLATLVSAANAAAKGVREIQKGTQDLQEGNKAKGILELVAGISDITAAAVAAGKAIGHLFSSIFDRNKGRDLVEDFAKSLGGFEALHQQLLMLGDEGERLWIKLTQGVGRNNPQQAQAAIDEVTDALEEQRKKQEENKDVTEEQAQATIETATEAAKALDELGGKLDISREQWKAWGADVTGVLDNVARAARGIQAPSPDIAPATIPGFASGTHGKFLDFGTGRTVRLHGKEKVVTQGEENSSGNAGTVVLELDRHVMARILVPAIADEVRRVRLS